MAPTFTMNCDQIRARLCALCGTRRLMREVRGEQRSRGRAICVLKFDADAHANFIHKQIEFSFRDL